MDIAPFIVVCEMSHPVGSKAINEEMYDSEKILWQSWIGDCILFSPPV